jgi:hypothetical protein
VPNTKPDLGLGRFAPYVNATVTGGMLGILTLVLYTSNSASQMQAERQDSRLGIMVDMASKQAQIERGVFAEQTRRQWEAIAANQKALVEIGRQIEKHDGTAMEQLKLLNVIADELKKKNGKN